MSKTENTDVMDSANKRERPIIAFWNKHRKSILIATGVVGFLGSTILAILGIKKHYWNATAFERWFNTASLDELKSARDNIHSEYMNHTINDEYREFLWNLLPRFDKKIREIEDVGMKFTGPAYSREHGYNLYKPD